MKKLLLVCVLAVVVFVVAPVGATILGTVNIQGHTNGLSDQSPLYGGGLAGGNYYTGVYSWTNAGGTGLGTQVPNWGFCIELPQGTVAGWQDVVSLDSAPMPAQYGTPMGAAKADLISELWGRHFNISWTTSPANKQMAEAFGAALWEIVYETDSTWDVTSGTGFHAPGIEQAATANAWLAELDGTGPRAFVYATSSPNGQDFVVPEPATMSLLCFGALSLLRRRK